MNYITHLTAVSQQFFKDTRLNPTHISLYMALFQYWNINRFTKVFYINREETMKMAKIGSKTTYNRCLQNLNDWKYIIYFPSHNPYRGSRVKMHIFCPSSGASCGTGIGQVVGQALVPFINKNKHEININKRERPKNFEEVKDFFKDQKWPLQDAEKFYNYYESIHWKIQGKIKIKDWHFSAHNWMLKANEMKTLNEVSQIKDNLLTVKNKRYDEPL